MKLETSNRCSYEGFKNLNEAVFWCIFHRLLEKRHGSLSILQSRETNGKKDINTLELSEYPKASEIPGGDEAKDQSNIISNKEEVGECYFGF